MGGAAGTVTGCEPAASAGLETLAVSAKSAFVDDAGADPFGLGLGSLLTSPPLPLPLPLAEVAPPGGRVPGECAGSIPLFRGIFRT